MNTWVDAVARTERNKPAGVLPCAIQWPTGAVGGPRPDWWNLIHYTENDTNYYTFPSQLGPMSKCLLLTYHMTGKEKYLRPIRDMARMRLAYKKKTPPRTRSSPDPNPGAQRTWTRSSQRSRSTDC